MTITRNSRVKRGLNSQPRVAAANSSSGVGFGWCGLSLLIDGRRFVGSALHLALTFLVLLLFARYLALALLE